MRAIVVLMAGLAVVAQPATGQAPAPPAGRASITVMRPLTISVVQRLRFGRLQPSGVRGVARFVVAAAPTSRPARPDQTPAVAEIRGDPGRAYRVVLPGDVRTGLGRHRVRELTLWSDTLGDVTRTRTGQLDAQGRDTFRIGGLLAVPLGLEGGVYSASIPLQIAYE